MAIEKTLQGIVRITENGDYNLVLPSNGVATQVGLPLQNADVYIIVEEILEPINVNIYMPKISDFNGGWNPKFYFLNKNNFINGDSSSSINSYSSETYSDWINTNGNTSYNFGVISFLREPIDNRYLSMNIIDNNYWLIQ